MPSQRKILLVDDVDFFLDLEKSFLQREEIDILSARNGQQAYDMIVLHRPDVVLLDLYMPEMDGDECCRLVKNDPELRNIPIIMVTTAGKEDEKEKCRQAGCDDIMLKPINRRIFMETVRKFLKVVERAAPRLPANIQVSYGKDKLFTDYSVNLSTGGLFLETRCPLAPDELLTLKFQLPEMDREICCKGQVAWVNFANSPCDPSLPPGMGIKFLDLGLDDLQLLRKFLQTETPEAS